MHTCASLRLLQAHSTGGEGPTGPTVAEPPVAQTKAETVAVDAASVQTSEQQEQEQDQASTPPTASDTLMQVDSSTPTAVVETPKKKKKSKKSKYKDLLASAMSCERTEAELNDAHMSKLQASTGGGQFSKLDKI